MGLQLFDSIWKLFVHINLEFHSRNDLPLTDYNKLEYVIKIDAATALRHKPFVNMCGWLDNKFRILIGLQLTYSFKPSISYWNLCIHAFQQTN